MIRPSLSLSLSFSSQRFLLLAAFVGMSSLLMAQTTPATVNFAAQPVPDRTVTFSVTDSGVPKPILWGLDLAWLSRDNIRRGIAFMGKERVDIVRSSFTPTDPLVDGKLKPYELSRLNERLSIISLLDPKTEVVLNCDHESVDTFFVGKPARWAQLIDETARLHQEKGRKVVSVSPFNEPDYGWGQGTMNDFYNIAGELRKNPRFDSIRICGGNTLNTDQALSWYNNLKSRLNEGNTHQLAGSFVNYANFYNAVRANGHHATNDELHNVMEAMVGVEYGMQTGIWWGTAEYARGEFVKASDGRRLGYAEHRNNWTAASVYRAPDGKIQAFGGTSERQAYSTTYRFFSKGKDVFFDGVGPQREYTLIMPGGTGYQNGQSNAERVVNITWGDDIQPVISGRYILVNRNSGKVLEVTNGSALAGANLRQNTNSGATHQQWNVTPVSSRIGGDFSYFILTAAHSGKAIDVLNWSLDNGSSLIVWDEAKGNNQQWFLEYAGNGYFYIRSRHSAKCLEVANNATYAGAAIQQWDKDGGTNQQWRLIPVGTTVEFTAPAAPAGVVATSNPASVKLDWTANAEADLSGYTILRADSASGPWQTLARNVTTSSFVDNTATTRGPYFYTVKAVDKALNRSVSSEVVSAAPNGQPGLVTEYRFDGNLNDTTFNLNHASSYGTTSYVNGKMGKALSLGGASFVQLPGYVANTADLTVATWVLVRSSSNWQRIFDFGNGEDEHLFLTPRSDAGQLRFAIKKNGVEQQLNAKVLPVYAWTHVAVTLDSSSVCLYVNGEKAAETTAITIRPDAICPALNYIGRSQYSDPLLNGYVDDFRIYNHALSTSDVKSLYDMPTQVRTVATKKLQIWPVPADDCLFVSVPAFRKEGEAKLSVYTMDGRLIHTQLVSQPGVVRIATEVLPAGMYWLDYSCPEERLVEKLVVRH